MTNGKEKRDQKNVLIGTLLAAVLIMAIGGGKECINLRFK